MNKSYGLYKLKSHLQFLVNDNPDIYEIYTKEGAPYATVFNKESAEDYKKEGYTVKVVLDIEKRIAELKLSIQKMENDS